MPAFVEVSRFGNLIKIHPKACVNRCCNSDLVSVGPACSMLLGLALPCRGPYTFHADLNWSSRGIYTRDSIYSVITYYHLQKIT